MTTNSCWVQDTFWWTFTALCNPEGADEDTSSALFDRLSCSFPRLMLSLGHNLKDIFLKHFYDALAQVCIRRVTHAVHVLLCMTTGNTLTLGESRLCSTACGLGFQAPARCSLTI